MYADSTRNEFLSEFLAENRVALDQMEHDLLRLEVSPGTGELVNTIFRNMHTVKGNCRMLEFARLEGLTHEAETLLDHLREQRVVADREVCSVLLRTLDLIGGTLDHIDQFGTEGEPDFTRMIGALQEIHQRADAEFIFGVGAQEGGAVSGGASPGEGAVEGESPPLAEVAGGDPQTARLLTVQLSIERLEQLVNLVGELGTAFNQHSYICRRDPALAVHSLDAIGQFIHNLHDEVLQYRFQPIGRIWDSYHRLVRDLAVATGKRVLLALEGEDTAVDRTVLLAIKEAFGHMIRNAVDHGIEPPRQRAAAGKSPVGMITLRAAQKQGQVHLEVGDDGGGIDLDRVRAKGVQRGLITEQRSRELREEELLRLILEPGFSTAEQVSRLSGRGTGLDVVESAVAKVGGTLQILNHPGVGTTFRIRIPQTVSIISTLLVRSGGAGYAIPQASVSELISYYGPEVARQVEGKLNQPMVRVRERLLPLLSLEQVLGEGGVFTARERLQHLRGRGALHLVILQTEERWFALAVEGIDEPVNLVVKPLPRALGQVAILAGAAIMPDGSVSFILDVAELARQLSGDPVGK